MPPDKERALEPANRIKSGRKPGTFRPGQSGNPTGRPKIIAEVRDLARAHTGDAIKALVDIVTGDEPAAARVSAAQALLDRGWGKPVQPNELSGPNGTPIAAAVQIYLPANGRDG